MPTPEEINKIAEEYGEYESKTPKYKYPAFGNPARQQKECAKELAIKARLMFTWLSKDYCIVPKSKVKTCYGMARNVKLANTVSQHIVEDDYQQGVMDVLQSVFGTALFNEEKE